MPSWRFTCGLGVELAAVRNFDGTRTSAIASVLLQTTRTEVDSAMAAASIVDRLGP